MSKNEKLILGKPYTIIAQTGNRMMKVSGDCLTEKDVKYFIDEGLITMDDVIIPEKKPESMYPGFEDIIMSIDEKFFPWKYFTYNLFKKYPAIAKSMILKEYANIACSKIKLKDTVFLLLLDSGNVVTKKLSKGILGNYACFPTMESAKEAYDSMSKGITCFI